MKIFYAGTPAIAVPTLAALSDKYEVSGVLTNPDQPSGRKRILTASPVKQEAVLRNLKIFQPEKIDRDFEEIVSSIKADLLVTFAFGKIFKESLLNIFPLGAVNIHPSLLPKYRGPSPITAAILNGDTETGITVQKMAKRMDAGDIYLQEKFPLSGVETTKSLTEYVSGKAPDMIIRVIEYIIKGKMKPVPQNDSVATYCHIVNKNDGKIDWSQSADKIEREIRAYNPWPGSFTVWQDKVLYLHNAVLYSRENEKTEPGCVLGVDKAKGILIQTGEGIIAVDRLQLQSKKAMDYKSFLNGNPQLTAAKLGDI